MGKIFMVLWSLVMLYANIRGYKTVYFSDRDELNKRAIENLNKAEKDGTKGILTAAVLIVIIIDIIFWLILTLTFTSPIVILYGCIVILYTLYVMSKLLQFLETKELAKKQIFPYFITPINTAVIISYILILLL